MDSLRKSTNPRSPDQDSTPHMIRKKTIACYAEYMRKQSCHAACHSVAANGQHKSGITTLNDKITFRLQCAERQRIESAICQTQSYLSALRFWLILIRRDQFCYHDQCLRRSLAAYYKRSLKSHSCSSQRLLTIHLCRCKHYYFSTRIS